MQKFNIYVKDFPSDTTEEELKEYFSRFGQVNNVKIMRSTPKSIDKENEEEVKN